MEVIQGRLGKEHKKCPKWKIFRKGGGNVARPCKAVSTSSRKIGKDEREFRTENENKLRGNNDKIKASSYLSRSQKKIFKYIVTELEESGILGNLDVFILDKCAIAIDRLREIEKTINQEPERIIDTDLRKTKEAYDKDFFRCCNELSLSPQSRAKLTNLNFQMQQQQEDPLLKALAEADDDDD